MKTTITCALVGMGLSLMAGPSIAGPPPYPQPGGSPQGTTTAQGQSFGLADIKALAKSGVSDDLIISQIRASGMVYRLNTADIIDLKNAGVSEKVIDYMINSSSVSSSDGSPSSDIVTGPPPSAPSPIVEEVVPAPGQDYVWVAGSWTWVGHRWVWVHGYWGRPPYGHAVWVPAHWVSHRWGWRWVPGHWR
jgi:hypothetical protein